MNLEERGNAGPATWVFGALLVVTVIGILYHQSSGYHYPASPPYWFELNVLGDLYEVFFLTPVGIAGIVGMRRQARWGRFLVAGVAANFAYNYAMILTGRQNMWVFLWAAKLALAGTTLCVTWSGLPAGESLPRRSRVTAAVYLGLVTAAFSGMMGRRLLASASGRMLDMTMQETGIVDWGEPVLRDPIVFFSFAVPLLVAAVIGLPGGRPWGGRAASLACSFIVSIVSVILFTGLVKEVLLTGAVSGPMLVTSAFMTLVAVPPLLFLRWLSKPVGS